MTRKLLLVSIICYLIGVGNLAFSLSANYWQCLLVDADNKEWSAQGNYKLMALNRAFEACKKQSIIPNSCKISAANCEAFFQGKSTRSVWRCQALDRNGDSWFSNSYANKDDAALAAKAYCQDNSKIPETCYAFPFICRNLNSGA